MTTEKYGDYVRVQFLDATYPVGEDIVECSRCGKQWTVPCSFDEDYS